MNIRIGYLIVFQILAGFSITCSGQSNELNKNEALQLIATIPLPNVNGRIDHLTYDPDNHKLFVAALGNNTIEVIDLEKKRILYSIKDMDEPQGIAFINDRHMIFTANGGNGICNVFDGDNYQKLASIKTGMDADNVRYDSVGKKIYVGYGNGGLAIIDALNFKQVGNIELPGHPESFQRSVDNKMYVNIPDRHLLVVIDLNKNQIQDEFKIEAAQSNYPMALDEVNQRIFLGCRNPSRLLVLDSQTGKLSGSYKIHGDSDDIFFDHRTKNIFISCGEGYIDVFRQKDADHYEMSGSMVTQTGARTCLYIPSINKLVVAAPAHPGNQAKLLVYSSASSSQ